MDVCIVGGGLAGLALALGMQERGIRAHVFEKVPKIRPHSGTAISLAANGKYSYHSLSILRHPHCYLGTLKSNGNQRKAHRSVHFDVSRIASFGRGETGISGHHDQRGRAHNAHERQVSGARRTGIQGDDHSVLTRTDVHDSLEDCSSDVTRFHRRPRLTPLAPYLR